MTTAAKVRRSATASPSWRSLTDGATARAARRPAPQARPAGEASGRPELRVVRGIIPSPRTLPFLALVIGVLACALVSSMLLNAWMADTAYKMKTAQVELNVLNDHIETVRAEVQEASAADTLAARAAELGMVPAAAPGVIDLTDSTLAGGAAAEADDAQ
ncbi:hypothetical protein [Actinomyces ruminicola]|uniref:Cell division protein FtsL n=1 Tax=Actinomyces ruminicola TaxID=332524 RepID=A0A1G9TPF8_9ACTO|nr:hypothetical protein [Actinomyces ruminicola]SDM49583.1 hypothetical protein SAMN04487766_10379 [Actinomyces ruminicola]SDN17936.1 hypothetical protein SAMN05216355_10178 [Actinomyces ruminicola]